MQTKNVLISGASGMIGSALSARLAAAGYQVYALDRDSSRAAFNYHAAAHKVVLAADTPLHAVINLAGPSLADKRWTAAQKAHLKNTRVQLTTALSDAIAESATKPEIFLSASAIGYYGLTGANVATEQSPAGDDFLADLAKDWERATHSAEQAGVNTIHLRTGVVLSDTGGMLKKLLLPFKLGLGGQIGNGRQYISWISLPDAVAIMYALIESKPQIKALNLVAPAPVTNAEFTRELARALHRPAIFPLPAFVAQAMFGEMADLLLLGSAHVQSTHLSSLGVDLRHPTLRQALTDLLVK